MRRQRLFQLRQIRGYQQRAVKEQNAFARRRRCPANFTPLHINAGPRPLHRRNLQIAQHPQHQTQQPRPVIQSPRNHQTPIQVARVMIHRPPPTRTPKHAHPPPSRRRTQLRPRILVTPHNHRRLIPAAQKISPPTPRQHPRPQLLLQSNIERRMTRRRFQAPKGM